jgi:DNA-binding MarR family transcriptional regulator
MKTHVTSHFYLALLEFLLNSKQRIMAIGDEFGLTSTQAITLLLVNEGQPRPMKNFCTLFHCDASNVTGLVDGLEKKGLVSRQSDTHDRRIKVIQLEPAGKRMQQAIIERLETSNDFMLQNLSEDEQQQFVTIVEKLAARE